MRSLSARRAGRSRRALNLSLSLSLSLSLPLADFLLLLLLLLPPSFIQRDLSLRAHHASYFRSGHRPRRRQEDSASSASPRNARIGSARPPRRFNLALSRRDKDGRGRGSPRSPSRRSSSSSKRNPKRIAARACARLCVRPIVRVAASESGNSPSG